MNVIPTFAQLNELAHKISPLLKEQPGTSKPSKLLNVFARAYGFSSTHALKDSYESSPPIASILEAGKPEQILSWLLQEYEVDEYFTVVDYKFIYDVVSVLCELRDQGMFYMSLRVLRWVFTAEVIEQFVKEEINKQFNLKTSVTGIAAYVNEYQKKKSMFRFIVKGKDDEDCISIGENDAFLIAPFRIVSVAEREVPYIEISRGKWNGSITAEDVAWKNVQVLFERVCINEAEGEISDLFVEHVGPMSVVYHTLGSDVDTNSLIVREVISRSGEVAKIGCMFGLCPVTFHGKYPYSDSNSMYRDIGGFLIGEASIKVLKALNHHLMLHLRREGGDGPMEYLEAKDLKALIDQAVFSAKYGAIS